MKVENVCFYYPDIDLATPVDLQPNCHGYQKILGLAPGTEKGRHGIQWTFEGRVIRIRHHDCQVSGWPSPAMDKMVVRYHYQDRQFPAPRNIVIYNPDGSLHLHPEAPMTKAPKSAFPNIDPVASKAFDQVGWVFKNELLVMIVELDMGINSAIETRIFNPYTGECEDFLGTWRM